MVEITEGPCQYLTHTFSCCTAEAQPKMRAAKMHKTRKIKPEDKPRMSENKGERLKSKPQETR